MALTVECPECFQTYTVPERLAGKKIKCKSCSAPILVRAPETLTRLPPRSSESKPPRSKPSSSRKKNKKSSKRSSGPAFSLSDLDSPFVYLLIIGGIICYGIYRGMSGNPVEGPEVGLLGVIMILAGSRLRWLGRRGETSWMSILLALGIFAGLCAFGYHFRMQKEAEKKNGGQTAQNQASDEKLQPVPIPEDVALPAGTKLFWDRTGEKSVTLVEDSDGDDVFVQIHLDEIPDYVDIRLEEHPNREVPYPRAELMISPQVIQQLRDRHKPTFDPVAANRASIARAQQEKTGPLPDPNLVPVPVGFPIREGVELYHHYESRDAWYQVSVLLATEDYVKIQYLENDTQPAIQAGSERTVARSELFIDRATVKESRSNPVN